MKYLVLISISCISLFGLSWCRPTEVANELPAPNLNSLSIHDPSGVEARWKLLKSNVGNPILGYKLSIWEPELTKVYSYETDSTGKKVLVEKQQPADDTDKIPKSAPVAVITVGPQENRATYEHLKPHVRYSLRVQAFNYLGDGPYSNRVGIELKE